MGGGARPIGAAERGGGKFCRNHVKSEGPCACKRAQGGIAVCGSQKPLSPSSLVGASAGQGCNVIWACCLRQVCSGFLSAPAPSPPMIPPERPLKNVAACTYESEAALGRSIREAEATNITADWLNPVQPREERLSFSQRYQEEGQHDRSETVTRATLLTHEPDPRRLAAPAPADPVMRHHARVSGARVSGA